MRSLKLNLFALHGKYFRDDENRLTANLAFLMSEARRGFLPAFLGSLGLESTPRKCERLDIALQQGYEVADERSIVDVMVTSGEDFAMILESKIGQNSLSLAQARKYARVLATVGTERRMLVFVTQICEPLIEAAIRNDVSESKPLVEVRFIRWRHLFELIEASESILESQARRWERRIEKGLPVSSTNRFCTLFLDEVRSMTYDLCVIDDLSVGDVEDVVIQAQDPRFMRMALEHNVWFPPSQSKNGLRPTKYVAYYQTAGNDQSGHVSHVARVRKVWNRVSYGDAKSLPEFQSLFADQAASDFVSGFRNKEGLFHIAATDAATALAHPIPLGDRRTAQFLTKKRLSLSKLLSAKSTDDFLLSKRGDCAA